jgi:hypothetical protein
MYLANVTQSEDCVASSIGSGMGGIEHRSFSRRTVTVTASDGCSVSRHCKESARELDYGWMVLPGGTARRY